MPIYSARVFKCLFHFEGPRRPSLAHGLRRLSSCRSFGAFRANRGSPSLRLPAMNPIWPAMRLCAVASTNSAA